MITTSQIRILNDTDERCRNIDSSDKGKQTFTDTKSNQKHKFDEIMSIHSKRENLIVLHSDNIASTCRKHLVVL